MDLPYDVRVHTDCVLGGTGDTRAHFLDALRLLEESYSRDPSTFRDFLTALLRYRSLLPQEALAAIDTRILELLAVHPEAVPEDCFSDRLPAWLVTLLYERRLSAGAT